MDDLIKLILAFSIVYYFGEYILHLSLNIIKYTLRKSKIITTKKSSRLSSNGQNLSENAYFSSINTKKSSHLSNSVKSARNNQRNNCHRR